MIDGKPYQQHVVQQFYAVDGSSNDTQVYYVLMGLLSRQQ